MRAIFLTIIESSMKNRVVGMVLRALCVLLVGMGTAQAHGATDSVAVVLLHNNSGRELVVAMVQGAAAGQAANKVAWLQFAQGSTHNTSWVVPPTPSSNTDLLPFMTSLGIGDSIVISVPEYAGNVGFRCLLADTAFRSNAMQYLYTTIDSTTDSVAYMAFPDLETATYVFDKFEAGLTIGFPGIWNITAVDFVALPMQLSCNGVKVGFKDGVTSVGLQQLLSALPPPYSYGGTVAPNTANTTYRFFSPSHIDSVPTALDSQITRGLPLLQTYAGTIAYGNYTFASFSNATTTTTTTGTVVGSITCNYTNTAVGVGTPTAITVNDITTEKSFAGTIIGATNANINNANAQVELGAILSAAICRGVLGNPNTWGDIVHTGTNCATPWNYYPAGQQCDSYSKLVHSYSIDGKNYGFPYDDYFGDEAGLTAVAGDTISVTILPYTGTLTAQPNGPMPVRTGCLVATVPASTIYPNDTASWKIGPVKVEANLLLAGSNQLCFLNSDTVVCTFPQYPAYAMHLSMACSDSADAITYYKHGVLDTLLSISGVYYNSCTRTLSFGTGAAWQQQKKKGTNCVTIVLPTAYPSDSGWNIGTIRAKGKALVQGANSVCLDAADSVVCTFPSDTAYTMRISPNNKGNNNAITYYRHGVLDTSLSISNVSYQSSTRTLSFGATAAWITPNCIEFVLPSSYPDTANNWDIGPIVVGGDTLATGTSTLCFHASDTVICTFPQYPKVQMRVLMKKQQVQFYKQDTSGKWKKNTTLNIVGFSPQPHSAPYGWLYMAFGASASWIGNPN